MPWVIGIDEAGYGPNMGPFVASRVAVWVPRAGDCPWELLAPAVRRAAGRGDGRLIVDDSKAVHNSKAGPAALERNVWPFLPPETGNTLGELWRCCVVTPAADLVAEPWADAAQPVPVEPAADCDGCHPQLRHALDAAGVRVGYFRSVVLFPRQFNALVDQFDSKAAAPLQALRHLLTELPLAAGERRTVVVDRLGGRLRYHPFLQECFPDELVLCRDETPQISSYAVADDLDVQFEVRADQRWFAVALASMLSKYLREVLMAQFNAYFQRAQPGLEPTAGYPGDAARFWQDTAATRRRLGLADDSLWRKR